MNHVSIISDGLGRNTQVLVDGKPLQGIIKIEICDIEPKTVLMAKITVRVHKLILNKVGSNCEKTAGPDDDDKWE